MIGEHDWHAVPNDEVETWCLLIIDFNPDKRFRIEGWELGFGNSTKLVRTVPSSLDKEDGEEECIRRLLDELKESRYQGVTLITPSQSTLSLLRSRILCCSSISDQGLRGFTHFDLQSLLSKYFTSKAYELDVLQIPEGSNMNEDRLEERVEKYQSVDDLWLIVRSLVPLVPREEVQGKPL